MINIPNYRILKELGSGGMGAVYLAEHELIKRKVAIKVLHKHLVSNKEFIKRFRREAELLATLDHPNIVRLNEYFEHEGYLCLIMEYVDGMELDQHINKVSGPINEVELIPMFKQILEAIGYAHKKGLVHRDIKPANILISKDGKIKVLDFGIAKMMCDDKGLTNVGVQVGTAAYMSPEQVQAEKVDLRTDTYSLGVTLYQMAVGQVPYANSNVFDTQLQIVSKPFPNPRDIYPGISDRLLKILEKAVKKDKGERYQSCEEFAKGFDEVLSDTVLVKSDNVENTSFKKAIEQDKIGTNPPEKKYPFKLIAFSFIVIMVTGFFYFSPFESDILNEPTAAIVVDSSADISNSDDIVKLAEDGIDELRAELEAEYEEENKKKAKDKKKAEDKKKAYHISSLKFKSAYYFNHSDDFSKRKLTEKGRDAISTFIMNSISRINRVSVLEEKYLVIIHGLYSKITIYDIAENKKVFHREVKGGIYTLFYCKESNVLCSNQYDNIFTKKHYIKLAGNTITFFDSKKKVSSWYSCDVSDLILIKEYSWD